MGCPLLLRKRCGLSPETKSSNQDSIANNERKLLPPLSSFPFYGYNGSVWGQIVPHKTNKAVARQGHTLPAINDDAGEHASRKFVEFFVASVPQSIRPGDLIRATTSHGQTVTIQLPQTYRPAGDR